MNEEKTYEPKKIEIEVGEHTTPLTIANGIILFLTEWRRHDTFILSIQEEQQIYEDVRVIGEALLSVYKAQERVNEADEKYRR